MCFCYQWPVYEEAITDLSQAISLVPGLSRAFYLRGCAWSTLGQYQKALDDYSQAVVVNPNHDGLLQGRAICYLNLGHPEQALVDLDRAIEDIQSRRIAVNFAG